MDTDNTDKFVDKALFWFIIATPFLFAIGITGGVIIPWLFDVQFSRNIMSIFGFFFTLSLLGMLFVALDAHERGKK